MTDTHRKMGAHIKVRPRSSNYRALGTERTKLSMRGASYPTRDVRWLLDHLDIALSSQELLHAATRRFPDGDLRDFIAFHAGSVWANRKALAIAAIKPDLRTMPYEDYLRTPEWQERRQRQIALDGSHCRLCNSSERLQVHHRTYANRGNEQPGDLVTLCDNCHATFHECGSLAA